jgi:hypothetical protein
MQEYKRKAENKIRSTWKKIAEEYTLGWTGPLAEVERLFPYVTPTVAAIRWDVSDWLPFLIFQTRESPPESMAVAVPFQYAGTPYNSRVLPTNGIGPEAVLLLGNFAQAVWFLIDAGVLPRPQDGERFARALVELTGPSLFEK